MVGDEVRSRRGRVGVTDESPRTGGRKRWRKEEKEGEKRENENVSTSGTGWTSRQVDHWKTRGKSRVY